MIAKQPIRSMTGFAQARATARPGEILCSLRAVNHRGLDLHFYLTAELAPFETAMRTLIKQHVARGHLDVRASLVRRIANETAAYDAAAVGRYVAAFRQAREEFGINGEPDLNVIFTLPDVFTAPAASPDLDDSFEAELLSALRQCLSELNASREREGAALANDVASILDDVERSVKAIAGIREQALPFFQARLRERLTELLAGSAIPEARIIEEAALLADKSDIQEELTRLAVHSQELRRILEAGGEIGKRLDFLLQEISRETNTTLAKSAGAGEPGLEITNLALAIKANIERMREQSLNFE